MPIREELGNRWLDRVRHSISQVAASLWKVAPELAAESHMQGAVGMYHYEHHLGDYLRDTVHLSMTEDGAYRRLIDHCYITECGLPNDLATLCKIARATSKPDRVAVALVMKEFFRLGDDGLLHQARIDQVIAKFHKKSGKASNAAHLRWEKERTAKAMLEPCERNANASPGHSVGNAIREPLTSSEGTSVPSGAVAPLGEDLGADPRAALWQLGVQMLGDKGRSIIGAAIRRTSEAKVAEVLGHMSLKTPADPVPYFMQATRGRTVVV